jgi:thiol-disulfide isomerase/thioredoxin
MKKLIVILIFLSLGYFAYSQTQLFYNLKGNSFIEKEITSSSDKTVLFFWTSHCPYCMQALRQMNEEAQLFEGIKVHFINLGEDRWTISRVIKYLKLKDSITENILLDPQNYLADKFNIIGVPTFVFLRNGKILRQTYYLDKDLLSEVFK